MSGKARWASCSTERQAMQGPRDGAAGHRSALPGARLLPSLLFLPAGPLCPSARPLLPCFPSTHLSRPRPPLSLPSSPRTPHVLPCGVLPCCEMHHRGSSALSFWGNEANCGSEGLEPPPWAGRGVTFPVGSPYLASWKRSEVRGWYISRAAMRSKADGASMVTSETTTPTCPRVSARHELPGFRLWAPRAQVWPVGVHRDLQLLRELPSNLYK